MFWATQYLQDPLQTEPMYLVIVLFTTERLYTHMTVKYTVHVSLLFCHNFTSCNFFFFLVKNESLMGEVVNIVLSQRH